MRYWGSKLKKPKKICNSYKFYFHDCYILGVPFFITKMNLSPNIKNYQLKTPLEVVTWYLRSFTNHIRW